MTKPTRSEPSKIQLADRFWSKVDRSGDCWYWLSSCDQKGYGFFWLDGRMQRAHRVALTLSGADIPDGMLVDHVCHNKSCVRPDHLRLATNKQNLENLSGPYATNHLGVRNVRLDGERYQVRVRHNGVLHQGGTFATVEEAEGAAALLRLRLFTHNALDRAV